MRLLTRTEEERLLGFADGSCTNGTNCVSPTENYGTAAVGGKCVMCCRSEATELFDGRCEKTVTNPYQNCTGDYLPADYLDNTDKNQFNSVTGPFVRYVREDYLPNPTRDGVSQTLRAPEELNWVDTLFVLSEGTQVDVLGTSDWNIVYCATPTCKRGIFTLVDQQRAMGVDSALFNLATNHLECDTCKITVSTAAADAETGLVTNDGKYFARCLFCRNVVLFDKLCSPQTCASCLEEFQLKALNSFKKCHYCKRPITLEAATQTFKLGDKTTVYLCKGHRIRGNKLRGLQKATLEEFERVFD
jgi:hypothetical protein